MTKPPALSAEWSVSADPSQVGIVRRQAAAQVAEWGLPDLVDPVCLLITELLTNAIEHTNGAHVDTRLSHSESILEIEVSDLGDGRARLKKPDAQQEHGRGLMIVDSIALDWGTRPRADSQGKSTWCTLNAENADSVSSAQTPASATSHHQTKSEPPSRAVLSLPRWLYQGARRLRSGISGSAAFLGADAISTTTTKAVAAA
ncbi:ATP-binding protein [Streptomyces sp. NPDC002547]